MTPWIAWQLLDSAFPTGGFAHSGGLEASWQAGEVRGGEGLSAFCRESLWQAGHASVPLVTHACAAPEKLPELDALAEALLTNHVARRASRAQGQALLVAADRAFGIGSLSIVREQLRQGRLRAHLAPMFGVVLASHAAKPREAAEMFLFTVLRALISAGVRLGIVGPLEGQKIQHELTSEAQRVAEECANLAIDDIAQTAPLVDLFQGTQDRLYSRLFQS